MDVVSVNKVPTYHISALDGAVLNDFQKAALYRNPEHLPVAVSLLPAAWLRYGDELRDLCSQYPVIFPTVNPDAGKPDWEYAPRYHAGKYTDPWGCVWENIHDGYDAMVTGHPLKNREDINALKPPTENMGYPHGFMFLRLTDLRGYEEMMIDFAEEPPELQKLLDIVLAYNLTQAQPILDKTQPLDVVTFGDDLGTQKALPISPVMWRKYLKPCFKAIYAPFRAADRIIYMHTDGCIHDIIPDLIECGVQVLNPQIRANGLDNLVRTCKGKVCINLDLDRQMFPFASPKEVHNHIAECVRAMYMPEGGLMLIAECAADVPLDNIRAICDALMEFREYKG
ncbi:hypothetical protein AGMMS49992_19690 [Clostridia bacterium]|nr:hypothetical protein AGMMS49992_19690 [Clostridia bacterium]